MDERTELEKLNTELYEKMYAEQEAFRARLLSLSPAEVLDHAYEYLAREDILLSREFHDLDEKQCRALLKTENLMDKLYHRFGSWPQSRMDEIEDMTESYANALLREEFIRRVRADG